MGERSQPIPAAGVIVDDSGRIVAAGPRSTLDSHYDDRRDHQVLMPGVLNCHVHLTDAGEDTPVPGGAGLNAWVRKLLSQRSGEPRGGTGLNESVAEVLERMRRAGTVAVGEVVNNYETFGAIARSGMHCRFIHELISFRRDRVDATIAWAEEARKNVEWPATMAHTLGAHAPYSVSPELMRRIAGLTRDRNVNIYQHLAEDPDERLLYESTSGPWRNFLEQIGAWEPEWTPAGCSPIEYYDRMGILDDHFVAVHLADATADELAMLGARGVRAILSPVSNLHITGLLPKLDAIVGNGIRFALGTDGRGSNPGIDVFDEARVLLERWPDLPAGIFLDALTTEGAAILGFDDLGAIAPGNVPGLVAVQIERITDDIRSLEQQIILSPIRRDRVA
ncbi:MAG: Cytosine deaminase-like protein [Chlorobi bacterium]|nr:Cytosine deaminase-like protein [Chlorobiota bacterium]